MQSTASRAAEFLLLTIVAFGLLAFGAVEPWATAVLEFSCFGLFILSVGELHGRFLAASSLLPAAGATLVIGLIQVMHVRLPTYPKISFPFTVSGWETAQALVLWSAYVVVLAAAPSILARHGAPRRLVWTIFVLGVIVSLVGIAQEAQGNLFYYGLRPIEQGTHPFGPFTNRDHAACLLIVSIVLGLCLCLEAFGRLRASSGSAVGDQVAVFLLLLFLLSVLGMGLFETRSRGAFVALVAALAVLMFFAGYLPGRRNGWLLATILTIAILSVSLACFHSKITALLADPSVRIRFSLYRSGFKMLRDFPMFGLGLGSAMSVFSVYQEMKFWAYVDHVHSDWLELALQVGIVGIAAWSFALVTFVRRAICSCSISPSNIFLVAGAISGVIAIVLHSAIDFPLQLPGIAVLLIIMASLVDSQPLRGTQLRAWRWSRAIPLMILAPLMAYSAKSLIGAWYAHKAISQDLSDQPYYWARAGRWDNQPYYSYRLAATYQELSLQNPEASTVLLRQALASLSTPAREEPLSERFVRYQGDLLRQLGRGADAEGSLP